MNIKYTEIFRRYSRIFFLNLITTRFIITLKNIKAKNDISLWCELFEHFKQAFYFRSNHILSFRDNSNNNYQCGHIISPYSVFLQSLIFSFYFAFSEN